MNVEDYETLPTNNVATHMSAGAIAGVMEHCVMYPLDSVKTRLQSFAPSAVREGVSGTLIRMMRTEGILRPVRGMPAMVVGAGPAHALYFSSYEYLKETMLQYTTNPNYQTLVHGSAGCISTLLHDGIMNPAEVVKQRMQMSGSIYRSASECVRHVYRNEGSAAFYRSYTTQLTMNIPFQSIHFMVYEFAQKVTNKERIYNPTAHMVSGALAGAVAAAITTPLDVCKTLLNTQQGGTTSGMLQAVQTVYRLGGISGYFRGMQARIMYQMPATAICWSTYEFFKYVLTADSRIVLAPSGGSTVVFANNSKADGIDDGLTDDSADKERLEKERRTDISDRLGLKPRELPAMSGAGMYGSLSFNTMHNVSEPSLTTSSRRRHGGHGLADGGSASVLDLTHT